MARFVSSGAILICVVLAAFFVFTQIVRRTSMFFPERYPLGDWDTRGLPVTPRDATFRTSDGVMLHGWLFEGGSPLILWFHGNGGNITHRAPVAAELARRGVSVLLAEWRGYGRSGGSPHESALYRDADAAYDYARTVLGRGANDIVPYGESLGGPYAAHVAKRGARCVVIENSFPSMRALGNAIYAPLPLGWFAPRAMRTAAWLNQAGVPVLVMHGRRDPVIPYRLGTILHDELRVPKQFMASDRAGHCEIPQVEAERYYRTVLEFVRRH